MIDFFLIQIKFKLKCLNLEKSKTVFHASSFFNYTGCLFRCFCFSFISFSCIP